MGTAGAKRFRAVLEPSGNNLGWIIARVPFDIDKAWKKLIRLRVTIEIGEEVFRTSLFPDAVHGGYFVLVNKKMQRAAGAKVGAMIDLTIASDLEEREAELTPEFEKILKREKAMARWFAGLSDSMRREIGKWLDAVKGPEARQRRAEQMAERLLLTMEGEKILPPALGDRLPQKPHCPQGLGRNDPSTTAQPSARHLLLSKP